MSIRARIALFGAGVVALAVLLFGVLLYVLVAYGLLVQRDRALVRRGEQAAVSLLLAGPPAFQPRASLAPVNLAQTSDSYVEILDADGAAISSTGLLDGVAPTIGPSVREQADARGFVLATIRPEPTHPLRIYARPWARPDLGLRGYVVTGQPERVVRSQLQGLRTFLLLAALLSLLCALATLWIVSGRSLRPLKLMARTADEIGQTEGLSRRLPAVHTQDEIGRLTESFNAMLARLEETHRRLAGALDAQKQFVADASHELRTPLTTIRSNAGFLLHRRDSSPQDREAALADIATESERMSRLVQALLTLARADAGQHLDRSPLELAALVADVCRQAATLHPSRSIDFVGIGPVHIDGNEDALRELTWILLDNAVKHTGSQGQIWVAVASHEGSVELRIADEGPGIPTDDLQRIFERFVQVDPARGGSGAGLGLAIAGWIVAEHEGRISASNREPHGAVFVVEIPLHRSSDS